ncbi:MAG: hypothetical protein U0T56_05450 [Ferruginibacter sp.]
MGFDLFWQDASKAVRIRGKMTVWNTRFLFGNITRGKYIRKFFGMGGLPV